MLRFVNLLLVSKLRENSINKSKVKKKKISSVQSLLLPKYNFLIECCDEVAVTIQLHSGKISPMHL